MKRDAWYVLITDDEDDIHTITKMIFRDEKFDGYPIKFYDAYSKKEMCEIMSKNSDIAVVLLDIIMESEYSGLEAVNEVRNKLENDDVRIILRTGQSIVSSNTSLIKDYEINGYNEKSRLYAQELINSVIFALRNYRDIKRKVDDEK